MCQKRKRIGKDKKWRKNMTIWHLKKNPG